MDQKKLNQEAVRLCERRLYFAARDLLAEIKSPNPSTLKNLITISTALGDIDEALEKANQLPIHEQESIQQQILNRLLPKIIYKDLRSESELNKLLTTATRSGISFRDRVLIPQHYTDKLKALEINPNTRLHFASDLEKLFLADNAQFLSELLVESTYWEKDNNSCLYYLNFCFQNNNFSDRLFKILTLVFLDFHDFRQAEYVNDVLLEAAPTNQVFARVALELSIKNRKLEKSSSLEKKYFKESRDPEILKLIIDRERIVGDKERARWYLAKFDLGARDTDLYLEQKLNISQDLDEKELESAEDQISESSNKGFLCRMGDYYTQKGDIEKAFRCYSLAKRNGPRLETKALHSELMQIQYAWEKTEKYHSFSDLEPIFIVGMPRSGTSICEKTICTSSEYLAVGETPYVGKIIEDHGYPTTQMGLLRMYEYIQNEYPRRHFTDKTPLNFRYIGWLSIVYPKAKFIHCIRAQEATAWGIYKQYFPATGLPFQYSYEDALLYTEFSRELMRFWERELKGRVFTFSNECFIQDREKTILDLGTFLNIDLSRKSSKLYMSQTASKDQLSQTYKSPNDEWKLFQKYLNV